MMSMLFLLAAILFVICVFQYMKCYTWAMGEYPHLKGDNEKIRLQLDDFVFRESCPVNIKIAYRTQAITFVCAMFFGSLAIVVSGRSVGYAGMGLSVILALYMIVKLRKLK